MTKPQTTKRGNGQRIIHGLRAAIAYVKGDVSKGTLTRFRVKNGTALRIVK